MYVHKEHGLNFTTVRQSFFLKKSFASLVERENHKLPKIPRINEKGNGYFYHLMQLKSIILTQHLAYLHNICMSQLLKHNYFLGQLVFCENKTFLNSSIPRRM